MKTRDNSTFTDFPLFGQVTDQKALNLMKNASLSVWTYPQTVKNSKLAYTGETYSLRSIPIMPDLRGVKVCAFRDS